MFEWLGIEIFGRAYYWLLFLPACLAVGYFVVGPLLRALWRRL